MDASETRIQQALATAAFRHMQQQRYGLSGCQTPGEMSLETAADWSGILATATHDRNPLAQQLPQLHERLATL